MYKVTYLTTLIWLCLFLCVFCFTSGNRYRFWQIFVEALSEFHSIDMHEQSRLLQVGPCHNMLPGYLKKIRIILKLK